MGAMTLFSVRGFIGADGCDRSAPFIRGGTFVPFVRAAGGGRRRAFLLSGTMRVLGTVRCADRKLFYKWYLLTNYLRYGIFWLQAAQDAREEEMRENGGLK